MQFAGQPKPCEFQANIEVLQNNLFQTEKSIFQHVFVSVERGRGADRVRSFSQGNIQHARHTHPGESEDRRVVRQHPGQDTELLGNFAGNFRQVQGGRHIQRTGWNRKCFSVQIFDFYNILLVFIVVFLYYFY